MGAANVVNFRSPLFRVRPPSGEVPISGNARPWGKLGAGAAGQKEWFVPVFSKWKTQRTAIRPSFGFNSLSDFSGLRLGLGCRSINDDEQPGCPAVIFHEKIDVVVAGLENTF